MIFSQCAMEHCLIKCHISWTSESSAGQVHSGCFIICSLTMSGLSMADFPNEESLPLDAGGNRISGNP